MEQAGTHLLTAVLAAARGTGSPGVRSGCGLCNRQEMAAAWARAVMVARRHGVCFETSSLEWIEALM